VHDENGNEDPIKLAEAAIPRPAAKKKKVLPTDGDSPSSKKHKRIELDSTNERDIPESAFNYMTNLPPSMPNGVSETSEGMEDSLVEQPLSVEKKTVAVEYDISAVLDPELLMQDNNYAQSQSININKTIPEAAVTSPLAELKCEPEVEGLNSSQPLASSLVSPPDSTHAGGEQTPPATGKIKGFTPPTTSASSRHSSRPAKVAARFTPESGTVRRPSSSSAGGAFSRESTSPTTSLPTSATSHKRSKSRAQSEIEADEESLRLIRELQAADLGLRRRGRS
jgi:F-box and leucine-rich repeat protein 10/11